MDIDPLDRLLANAAPDTSFEMRPRAQRAVIRRARAVARPRRPRMLRFATAAAAGAVLAGGGTAVAAANPHLIDWLRSPVVQDPYVTYAYTLPSGVVCTDTSGDVLGSDTEAAGALRSWLATADLLSLIDIDTALTQVRSSDSYNPAQIGSDDEYHLAINTAVVLAARSELERQGYPRGSIDGWKTETTCATPAG